MPDERAEAARLAMAHNAEMLVTIFQSRSEKVGDGVCRGIVQHWLASHLDAAREGSAAYIEGFRKDVGAIDGSKASKLVALHEDLRHHTQNMSLANISFNRSPGREIARGKLGQITFSFDMFFPVPGFYYVSMPTHCFGLKLAGDHILFIDANTCEWRIPTQHSLHKAFLVDYISTLYPDAIQTDMTTVLFV